MANRKRGYSSLVRKWTIIELLFPFAFRSKTNPKIGEHEPMHAPELPHLHDGPAYHDGPIAAGCGHHGRENHACHAHVSLLEANHGGVRVP